MVATYQELFKSLDIIRADAAILGVRENVIICSYSLIRLNGEEIERRASERRKGMKDLGL